jgi:hypothetical protein
MMFRVSGSQWDLLNDAFVVVDDICVIGKN